MYEVIILSEPKKTHFKLSSIPPFIVAIVTLVEYRFSLVCRPDLLCHRKHIAAPILEASIQRVIKGFLWLFELLHGKFNLFFG